jgi:hypothetical protein
MSSDQKRDALNDPQAAESALLKLYYSEEPDIQARGNATGQTSQFSQQSPVHTVDMRDAVLLLQSKKFRPAK